MYGHRLGYRAEYRSAQGERVKASPSLAKRFRKLKSLVVNLGYYDPKGLDRSTRYKYLVNLKGAKSVFRFKCSNDECIGGDFDLTEELAKAVAKRQTVVTGELACQGWKNKAGMDTVHCHNVLRYKLNLGY